MAEPSSRKRTHAQITRSESHSLTPPPSKRQRTSFASSYTAGPSSLPQPTSPSISAMSHDDANQGFPSTPFTMTSQDPSETIDLTDDTPPPLDPRAHTRASTWAENGFHNEIGNRAGSGLATGSTNPINTSDASPMPPHTRNSRSMNIRDIIDLSGEEEDEEEDRTGQNQASARPGEPRSPEVQFISEQPRPQPPHRSGPAVPLQTPPIPQTRTSPSFGFIRQLTQGFLPIPFMAPHLGTLHQLSATLRAHDRIQIIGGDIFDLDDGEDYTDVVLDYERPAMGLVGTVLAQNDGTPSDAPNPRYKPPALSQAGYTRAFDETSILICVACEDELAAGDDELKRQVWVSRRCGHVYCGACVSERAINRGGNDRERKKRKRPCALRNCKAKGCNKGLTGKQQMFQIYL